MVSVLRQPMLYRLGHRFLTRHAQLRSGRLNAHDSCLHYLDNCRVQQPTLLLLHGLTGDHSVWLPVVRHLGKRYRVIIPDLAGHGESEFIAGLDYSAASQASRIAALVEMLGVDTFHVHGNSMGGWIACLLAERMRDRVRTVGLMCPAGMASTGASWLDLQLRAGNNPFLTEDEPAYRRFLAAIQRRPHWAARAFHGYLYRNHASRLAAYRQLYADYIAHRIDPTLLTGLRMRVGVVWSRHDDVLHSSALAGWRRGLPAARIDSWEDTGHLVMLDAPRRVARWMETLMKSALPEATDHE